MSDPSPSLPFALTWFERPGFLRVRVTGVNGSLATTVACWMVIAEAVRERRPTHLLIKDEMSGEPPPPAEIEQFIHAMAGQGFEGVRVAYVEADGEQVPQVEMGEIYAREHGFDARVFGNENDAEMWLRYGEKPGMGNRE
ncbi:MAG: hypothetical protein ACREO3_11095 [Arenimonas sp.]